MILNHFTLIIEVEVSYVALCPFLLSECPQRSSQWRGLFEGSKVPKIVSLLFRSTSPAIWPCFVGLAN